MTLMPRTSDWTAGDELTWDAWNRLTRIRPATSPPSSSSSSSSPGSYHSSSSSSGGHYSEVTYQYDARTRRTRKTNAAGTQDYYYDKQWRAIEEHISGTVTTHYVWSPLDRWTMIRRKRGSEEHYVLKDYLDPSAIINTSGTVIERFGYDAFGPVRFMDAAFAPRTTTAAAWNFLFHAEFLDEDTGLYNYGFRYYNPQLGRWPSRDPIGDRGGLNLYGFVRNDGVNGTDLFGLANCPVRCGGMLLGHITHNELSTHTSRKTPVDVGFNDVANGVSIEITFNEESEGLFKRKPCCCDEIRFLQVAIPSHETQSFEFGGGKTGGLDNGGKDSPFYDVAWNWSMPPYKIGDRPFASDGFLRQNRVTSDWEVMFYTFVVCVKSGTQDRILLSGLKWGYRRSYIATVDPLTGDPGPPEYGAAEIIQPECTGIRSFPRGKIQDTIENDPDANYDFRDEWRWDRT